MKRQRVIFLLFTFYLIHGLVFKVSAQQHRTICDLEVVEALTQEIAGRNIGFIVTIRNNNEKSFDALEYKVIYRDGFGDKVGEKEFKWQSGNIIGPIGKGAKLDDIRANWVKGANKIQVILRRVHFTDDSTCK